MKPSERIREIVFAEWHKGDRSLELLDYLPIATLMYLDEQQADKERQR